MAGQTKESMDQTPPREKLLMNQSRLEKMLVRPGVIRPIILEERQCGDGRSIERGISIFGGDALVMQTLAAMNTDMSPEEIVRFVIGINHDRGQKTYFHTDTHAKADDLHDIGCGQLKKPSLPENENLYTVDDTHILRAEDAERIIGELNKQAQENPHNVIKQELQGGHLEGSVVFNSGQKNTVMHDDGTDQIFVVDTAAGKKYLEDMYAEIVKRKPELAGRHDEFMKIQEHFVNITAHLLAAGLDIYEVNVDDPLNLRVKKIGTVE